MKWQKHWPAWVILEFSARADFQPFLDVAVARRCLWSDEETKGQDIDSVPHTSNSSIWCAFGGLQRSLLTYAFTDVLRSQ